MFVQKSKITKVEMKEFALKLKSVLSIDLSKGVCSPQKYRVLSNESDAMVVQHIDCLYCVETFYGDTNTMHTASSSTHVGSVTYNTKDKEHSVYFKGDQFFYQREVTSVVNGLAPIVKGNDFAGYTKEDVYVHVVVANVSDTQLVLSCYDTKTGGSTFVVLDKNTLVRDGDWVINQDGEQLSIDVNTLQWEA
jgi:hypothetical protein